MFLLFWLILLTSGARKQSRNRPAFRLPLSGAFKARPEPNGSNVFSISYGVENDEECLRNCLRHCLRHCLRTISETVLERGYIGTPKLAQFSRPDISALSTRAPAELYLRGKLTKVSILARALSTRAPARNMSCCSFWATFQSSPALYQ